MARKKSDPPVPPDAGPGRFGIVVRHNGFIDRIARQVPADFYYPADRIEHYLGYSYNDKYEPLRFPTREAAQGEADRLAGLFGEQRYRFSVIEERLVPQWFLVEPDWKGNEKVPVGSVEQL